MPLVLVNTVCRKTQYVEEGLSSLMKKGSAVESSLQSERSSSPFLQPPAPLMRICYWTLHTIVSLKPFNWTYCRGHIDSRQWILYNPTFSSYSVHLLESVGRGFQVSNDLKLENKPQAGIVFLQRCMSTNVETKVKKGAMDNRKDTQVNTDLTCPTCSYTSINH